MIEKSSLIEYLMNNGYVIENDVNSEEKLFSFLDSYTKDNDRDQIFGRLISELDSDFNRHYEGTVVEKVAYMSELFEKTNTELKRRYFLNCIMEIIKIGKQSQGFKGGFGTGYPFYLLDDNFRGTLPIVREQLRYNHELVKIFDLQRLEEWPCESCLASFGKDMPDLKTECKPCGKIIDELKPRKVINRLQDLDIFFIFEEEKIEDAEKQIQETLEERGIQTSDVDPLRTFSEADEIISDIYTGKMPKIILPPDIHITTDRKIIELIAKTPEVIIKSIERNIKPELLFTPISLRKTWQYDKKPINFILDYLLSLTPLAMENNEIEKLIDTTRKEIATKYSDLELLGILDFIAPKVVKSKMDVIEKPFQKRMGVWRR